MLIYILLTTLVLISSILVKEMIEKRKILQQLHGITSDLEEILSNDTDEKIMLFTDEKKISALIEQLNRALEVSQKVRIDYRKLDLKSKYMLSNISHDLKTPLTVIQGYLEIMTMDENNNAKMLNKVTAKTNQLMELMDKFFTLAKIEAGDIDLTKTTIQLCEFCRTTIIDFYEILIENEFQVDIQIPEKEIQVFSNEDALKRILNNLITNAIRYGNEGKYLGLVIQEKEKEIIIEVIDKGRGINKSETERIFDRLYTMDDSRNQLIQGNGLGLTIVKELAEKINAKIHVESEAHVRTAFILTLEKIDY
jgi:signal transduction histidine kinase